MPHPLRVGLPIAAAFVLGAVYHFTRVPVTIVDAGRPVTLRTHAASVGAALHEAGIQLYPEDFVSPASDSPLDSGQTITVARAGVVHIDDGASQASIRTRDASPYAALNQAGIQVSPGDGLWVDGIPLGQPGPPPGSAPQSIAVRRPVPIQILDQGIARTVHTSAATVGEALWAAGIRLYSGDGVQPDLGAPVTPDLTVTLTRSAPVEINVDGRVIRTRTHQSTVGGVLADAGVVLVGSDFTRPGSADPLPSGSPIEVVRVKEEILTQQEYFPFELGYQAAPDLEIDTSTVLQAGADGISETRVRVRYENGVEVGRTVEAEWVAREALPKIIGYGTGIVVRSMDTPQGPVEYWRAIRMYATSYSASRAGTPKTAPWYGRTRSGKVLTLGMVAVDPRVIPLGTPLYIPGYGLATAEDTGNGIKGRDIDLGYDDWNYIPWHSYVTVYVRTPVPPEDQIRWVLP